MQMYDLRVWSNYLWMLGDSLDSYLLFSDCHISLSFNSNSIYFEGGGFSFMYLNTFRFKSPVSRKLDKWWATQILAALWLLGSIHLPDRMQEFVCCATPWRLQSFILGWNEEVTSNGHTAGSNVSAGIKIERNGIPQLKLPEHEAYVAHISDCWL